MTPDWIWWLAPVGAAGLVFLTYQAIGALWKETKR